MKKLTAEEFIVKAKLVHGDRYDYSKVNYVNNKTKVVITCPLHGDYLQQPSNHITNEQKCPKCSELDLDIFNKGQAFSNNEFITKAKLIHKCKYDYSKVQYVNKKTPVIIICDKHGEFLQKPMHHLRKCGCPQCNESKGEQLIKEFLDNKGINYIKQKTFQKCKIVNLLPFDFYLPDYNLCIEYDGEQHFKPIKKFGGVERFKKQQITDKIKTSFCLDNNIGLIRIKFDEKLEEKLLF